MTKSEVCCCQIDNEYPIKPSEEEIALRNFYIDIILDIVRTMISNIGNCSPSYSSFINMDGVSCLSWILYSQDNYDYDGSSSSLNLLPTGELVDVIYTWDGKGTFQHVTNLHELLSRDTSICKNSKNLRIICESIIKIATNFNISKDEISEWSRQLNNPPA